EFRSADLSTGNSRVNSFWEAPYSLIYHANAILEGLAKSTGVTAASKQQFRGEAKFLRAFNYFYLVNYFGDVPLILNTDYKVNTLLPREKKEKVYESIVKDLIDAEADLSDTYINGARTRANKSAATALLARTYLYLQQWDKAEAEATKVITNPQYQLLTDLNSIFLKNSKEAVWQLESVNKSTAGVNTWEGFSIVPATPTGRAYYNLYDELVNAFESGDLRKDSWTKTYVTGGKTYYFPYKYKIRTSTTVSEYSMVIRFAELYLIRAEARTQLNNLDGAKDDLDQIRHRALLGSLPINLSQTQMKQAVAKERRIELFSEWGHRWFDLRRTGKSIEVLSPLKPAITSTDLFYPIPLSAIKTNPNLIQNDGYQ
ncbi:MAG: RagB/SusD family nutrient uptake outer membrane protein, partial [Bacteroidetes bacterium]|nr:RagB/SusD family nutrient uptake outer membrane protein [Bacteroidota bacterium]